MCKEREGKLGQQRLLRQKEHGNCNGHIDLHNTDDTAPAIAILTLNN